MSKKIDDEVVDGLVMEAEKAVLKILQQLEEDTGRRVESIEADTRRHSYSVSVFLM